MPVNHDAMHIETEEGSQVFQVSAGGGGLGGEGWGLVLAVDLAVETESLLAGQLVQEPCTVLVTYGLALSPKSSHHRASAHSLQPFVTRKVCALRDAPVSIRHSFLLAPTPVKGSFCLPTGTT